MTYQGTVDTSRRQKLTSKAVLQDFIYTTNSHLEVRVVESLNAHVLFSYRQSFILEHALVPDESRVLKGFIANQKPDNLFPKTLNPKPKPYLQLARRRRAAMISPLKTRRSLVALLSTAAATGLGTESARL